MSCHGITLDHLVLKRGDVSWMLFKISSNGSKFDHKFNGVINSEDTQYHEVMIHEC